MAAAWLRISFLLHLTAERASGQPLLMAKMRHIRKRKNPAERRVSNKMNN
jgi:hypothetical protein